jgi:TRAP-type uncharacterized transport system substrate-binding protein
MRRFATEECAKAISILPAAVVCAWMTLAGGPSGAQGGSDFYKGKTITLLVGSTAGGGYDLYARTLARFLGAHIPGNPTVIVQNMPGAGSLTSVLYLDNAAPQDGTYMTIFNAGLLTEAIVNPAEAKVDFRKLNWIGSITPDLRICYTWAPLGINTWDDLAGSRVVTLGATGQSSSSYNDAQMLKNLFHRKVRSILGYPGRSEVHLAIRRGEIDGECGSIAGLPDDFLTQKLINIPTKLVNEPIEGVPTAPFIGAFAQNDEEREILKVLTAANEVGRPFVASAATPADRVQILRAAFDATMKDADFLKVARTEAATVMPMSSEKAEELIAGLYKVSPDIAAKAKAAIR